MALELTVQLVKLLEQWETSTPRLTGDSLIEVLTKIAEIFETATILHYKKDPDPFDGRHPGHADPDCAVGHMLKKIFKHQDFVNAVLNQYLDTSAKFEVQSVTCRILLDLLPGLEPQVLRDNQQLVKNLVIWSERSPNPLRSYSLGVLAVAMDDEDMAVNFKVENSCLVPVMIERLHDLNNQYFKIKPNFKKEGCSSSERPFAHLNEESNDIFVSSPDESSTSNVDTDKFDFLCPMAPPPQSTNEFSNSSWSEMEPLVIGQYQVYPLTLANEQRYILQYLTSVGIYEELQTTLFEDPAKILHMVARYISLKQHSNIRLAFDALRYLGTLLCHKKCAVEFISKVGLDKLLKVHRPSLAATGVSFVLYYLGTNEVAMQKICVLPQKIIHDLVSYALWLLECSHSSGRAHSIMFFEQTFQFDAIRNQFDNQDGLRKLLNTVSTLDIVVKNISRTLPGLMNEEDVVTSRHLCKHGVLALKKYFEAHAEAKAVLLCRSEPAGSYSRPTYKQSLEENIETIASFFPRSSPWVPIDQFLKLDGIHFLLKLIMMLNEWTYSTKAETVRNALDILCVCCVSDEVKLSLCDPVQYMTSSQVITKKIGISVILQCTVGEKIADCDVRRAALNAIINCVCPPIVTQEQVVDGIRCGRFRLPRTNEETLKKMWNCIRSNNGIMILRMLLTTKSPVMSADSIRAMACQALCGLARCTKVMQILSKLQLFASGQLQVLMKEPVLRDKRQEHAKFVKYCTKLLEMLAGGTPVHTQLTSITKAEIVAQTVITYDRQQLLKLIAQHLKENGLTRSASALVEEANIDFGDLNQSLASASDLASDEPPPAKRLCLEPHKSVCASLPGSSSMTLESFSSGRASPPAQPIQRHALPILRRKTPNPKLRKSNPSFFRQMSLSTPPYSPQLRPITQSKVHDIELSNPPVPLFALQSDVKPSTINLDSIVTKYLRSEHALCKTPCITCPPFDLFMSHSCPEPRNQNLAPANIAVRFMQKQFTPLYWARYGSSMSRKYVSSRFRDLVSFYDPYATPMTQCAFASLDEHIYIGSLSGEVKVFDIISGNEIHSLNCHETEITNIQTLKKSPLILTSAQWRRPVTALWNASRSYELVHIFQDECYAEFSKRAPDRIIATKLDRAQIYDLETGHLMSTLVETSLGNGYRLNRATFNHSDELVLSDGVIWDIRVNHKAIHKLDKFNPRINGVFHPNGLEILSNSEVWDMRTHRLLRTVPELEQSKLIFDSTGDVMYSAIVAHEIDHETLCFKRYGTSFRSFDASDYTCITTKDVQKGIHDICINPSDTYLAVIMSPLDETNLFGNESRCHVYEIGRGYEDDDLDGLHEEEEEPNTMQSDEGDDDDDDDDDDDNDDQQGRDQDGVPEDNQDGDVDDNALELADVGDDDEQNDDENDDDGVSLWIESDSNSESDDDLFFAFRE